MSSKFHPNTRTAWMLVALTMVMSAGVVALMHLASTPESQILYSQFDGNDYEIFVMDENGNVEQLTDNTVNDWGAGWSPDQSQIAYRSVDDFGYTRIHVMNADGSNDQVVSPENLYAGTPQSVGMPSWTPDGQTLAFEAIDMSGQTNNAYDIYVVNLDNDTTERITFTAFHALHPQFSPDGSQIAFAYETHGASCEWDCDIFVMNADGTNAQQLTTDKGMDVFPQWSPDGSQIVFHSEREGNSDIFVMNANGSQETNLTNSPTLERVATWSPDGNSIVFRSERDGDSDIYVMNLRSGETTQMTDNDVDDRLPDW